MAPSLRVLVSTDSAYPPKTPISVNSTTPTRVSTSTFDGEISIWVKDFHGEGNGGDGGAYFAKRSTMTYAIVVRGRFLDGPNGDEVVFGNVFEKPIRDSLPWGTAVAVKFMNWVDPTLELDIYGDKPWALSPALAGMSNIAFDEEEKHPWVEEKSAKVVETESTDEKSEIAARRKWFGDASKRSEISLKDEIAMEFANGLLDFNTLSATLPAPFHLSVPLLKYWDGQPVTYVCRRRSKTPVSSDGVYFSVAFQIIDESAKAELEKRQ